MILALIDKGYGQYGAGGTALTASDFMVFEGGQVGGSTETDPLVPSWVKNITSSEKSSWNTAYSWGNHLGLYRPVSWTPTWSQVSGKPVFTRTVTGLVPASGGTGTTRFLREDGNWAIPSGTGGGGDTTPDHVNQITTTQISNWNTSYNWGNPASFGFITTTSADQRYLLCNHDAISTSGIKNWNTAGYLGRSFNSTNSTGFPTEFGVTWSFTSYRGSISNASRGRDFDFYKQNNVERWWLRGYSTSSGNANAWKEIWHTGNLGAPLDAGISSQAVNKVWVGSSLPSSRSSDTIYFVTS